jgi:hypothetical protein
MSKEEIRRQAELQNMSQKAVREEFRRQQIARRVEELMRPEVATAILRARGVWPNRPAYVPWYDRTVSA